MRRLAALAFTAALVVVAPARAQRGRDLPENDPSLCPYCEGDPELMGAAGVVSHGGFEFANGTTASVDEYFPDSDFKWIETAHFELGFGGGAYRIPVEERKRVRAELERLALVLPEVDPKTRVLDPWLRAHLFGMRLEDTYQEFLELIEVEESAFPSGKSPWNLRGKYLGEGPYLGQKGKYEVIVMPSEAAHKEFLLHNFGLPVTRTQRYNVRERDSLIVVTNVRLTGLREDRNLHAHLVFNVSIQFANGFKHYSYDIPPWVREGLGHWMERRVTPDFNTFDASEGAVAEISRKADWEGATRKMVASGDAPSFAHLVNLDGFADFTLEDHYATWSLYDYFTREHPGFVARLLDGLKGVVDEKGYSDGSNLDNVHREIFRAELGMSYADLDRAWRAWVIENYQ